MEMKNRVFDRNGGFTLAELLIVAAVLVILFAGVLTAFFRSIQLAEISRNSSTAILTVKNRLVQITTTSFNQIFPTFNNATFTAAGLTGMGVSYIDNANPDLYKVTIVFCWQEKNGRVFGEDSNLNGQLDAGEDRNGNGLIDSPVQIVSSIFNKG
jgi:prepilin-type N-terminal cleavage/methylation domain-containing protein